MKDKNQNQIGEPTKKVSSVEWLIEQITDNALGEQLLSYMESTTKQAKQMHREQVIDTWIDCMISTCINPLPREAYRQEAEQYYNDTYGGDQ